MAPIRNYLVVGAASVLARLTGFVQYVLFAAVVGAGAVAEAYVAAFLLPNMIRRTISEGALNAVYVPILARRKATGGPADAVRFARAALGAMLLVALAGSVLAMVFMPAIIAALAPGFVSDPEKFADSVLFGRIGLVFFAVSPILAMYAASLSTVGQFAVPSFAVLVVNLSLIGVSLVFLATGYRGDRTAGLALACTTAVAGVVQFLIVRQAARRLRVAERPAWPVGDPDVVRMLLAVLPIMFLTGFSQINILFASQMSSDVPSAVAWLSYADRLFHLPLSFVSGAIGMVLLPTMVAAMQTGGMEETRAAFYRTLEFALLLSLPAAAALHVLADPIVDCVYRRGAFQVADTRGAAEILRWLAVGLPGFVLGAALLPAFTVRERYRLPILAALAGLAANVVATQAVRADVPIAAAPIGASAAAWVFSMIPGGALLLGRNLPPDGLARRRLPMCVLVAAATTVAIVTLHRVAGPWLDPGQIFAVRAGALALVCLAGLALHAALALVSGALDLGEARRALRRDA